MADPLPYRFIEELKKLPEVEAVYLFGSRARGDHRERSDIDLAVKMRDNDMKSWHNVMEIIENADTLLEIDCVNLNAVDRAFYERIMREKIQL